LFICVVDKTALKTEKNEKNEKKNDFHMWFSQIEISTGQIGVETFWPNYVSGFHF
jgi:hypothetical protein